MTRLNPKGQRNGHSPNPISTVMKYSINPMIYTNMFPVPVCIADEHIRSASLPQMKIILWLFRHSAQGEISSKEIACAVGLYESEVDDAIRYWTDCGVILSAGADTASPSSEAQADEKAAVRAEAQSTEPEKSRIVERIHINPPTHQEVAKRCAESKALRELFLTTEQSLGATLSCSMQGVLVMLHDDYGLSVEVISLLVEFAVSQKKATTKFISTTGRQWCEKEIDTIDKAMDYIEAVSTADRYWREFCEKTGVKNPRPSKTQSEFLHAWINNMNFSMDMILMAYEEMADHTDKFSFPYMNKVLVSWHKNGITTPAQAAQAKKEHQEKLSGKKGKASAEEKAPASYNLDAYTKKAFANPLNILNKE